MTVFVDTSALLAVLDADEANHPAAKRVWIDLVERGEELVCTNYVLVETIALSQRRLGIEAVRVLHQDIAPVLQVHWVDESAHVSAVSALLAAGKRDLSLVDWVSFETMRRLGIEVAFTLDQDFAEQQFTTLPTN